MLTSHHGSAYYGPTSASSVVLLLAATSLGAIWSSAAADFGPVGVLERFEQFGDRLWGIVGVQSVRYNGKTLSQVEKLKTVVQGLEKGRTGKKLEVVVVDYLREGLDAGIEGWKTYESVQEVGRAQAGELEFYQAPFDHPLWVLFSSTSPSLPCVVYHTDKS
jgi:acetoacetyl-CoA synthetase